MVFDTIFYAIWLSSFCYFPMPIWDLVLLTKSGILELFKTHRGSRVSLELKRFKQVHTTRSSVYPSRGVVPCLFLPRVPFLLGTTTL